MPAKHPRAKYLSYDKRREPEEISGVIGAVLENVSIDADIRHGRLISEWSEYVPSDWQFAVPVGVREGSLLVAVPDGATASLLKYQIPPLLMAIQDRYGAGLVTGVRISVDRKASADIPRE
jgi:predicted nucleic acid-binding Zn ribbon protein